MKTLYESLLDGFDTLNDKIDPREEIKRFLEGNYKSPNNFEISTKPNKDGYYVVTNENKNVTVQNKQIEHLTNGLFVFENIRDFYCSWCRNLKSLEGAPEKVGGEFNCMQCNSLTTLKGAPKIVGGIFNCRECYMLTSLEGAPKKVGEGFNCNYCTSLKTLEGAPKKVGGDFNCSFCESLTSLNGAPEEVGGRFDCGFCTSLKTLEGAPEKVYDEFDCSGCGKQFTEDEVRAVSNVNGVVDVNN